MGEVNGLGTGCGPGTAVIFAEANRSLAAAAGQPRRRRGALQEALSLFVAQRRPSDLLAEKRPAPGRTTDSHLRLLARDGIISPELRDAALAIALQPGTRPPPPPPISFVERRRSTPPAAFLPTCSRWATSRPGSHDLTARTTLDGPSQAAVTRFLATLRDDAVLKVPRTQRPTGCSSGATAEVRSSFTLYEATPFGNLLRVQADNVDQPLDINVGTKLDLGSSAKFRTLVTYLEAAADLHRRYAGLAPEELRKIKTEGGDNLTRWAVEYLRGPGQGAWRRCSPPPWAPLLGQSHEKLLHRRRPAHFGNFKHEDDAKVPSVAEAPNSR